MVPLAPARPDASGPALPGAPPRRRRRRWIALVVVVVVLGFAILGASVVPVPYMTLRPGTTRPVTEQVRVEGVRSYPPEESIAYTTVGIG